MSKHIDSLIEAVFKANLELPARGLVTFTWGNVSAVDRKQGWIVIKPSGVPYEKLQVEDMVVTDMDGNIVHGTKRPSSDLATHIALYKGFPCCGSIVHTHARNSTAWAQSCTDLPPLGTTHADYFFGAVPCTRKMTDHEIQKNYELETGNVIVETFRTRAIDPEAVPSALVAAHGPFSWGKTPEEALYHAVVLEEIACMAMATMSIQPAISHMQQTLLDKHFLRKHGKNAYYGQ
ncbi:L-ribulose-5-phosphate 4-epimerase [Sediminispirochaeta bajacaliforniensis]|uniref:L-ribulose-5-phosphate 4-epimerase n=1 Tax=Sediminispirochaeta bajacaliforniensis TaxID=148 RepID=UPI00036AEF30|nr:L-ribulose-5-phosphate 4-epimerase [Sediminispirochaeta bajacaliforniensis]